MNRPRIELETDADHIKNQLNAICRRRAHRSPFASGAAGYLVFQGESSCQKALLCDISASGVSFFADWPLDSGAEVLLKLKSATKGTTALEAKVVHSSKQDAGNWLIGCRFTSEVTPRLLAELG